MSGLIYIIRLCIHFYHEEGTVNVHLRIHQYTPTYSPCFVELKNIAEKKEVPQTLEAYIKKLANCRRRVHLVNELLRSIQVCA